MIIPNPAYETGMRIHVLYYDDCSINVVTISTTPRYIETINPAYQMVTLHP